MDFMSSRSGARRVTEVDAPLDLRKSELIDEIRQYNPTATHDFLAEFPAHDLAEYLRHLQAAAQPRGRGLGRVRTGSDAGPRGYLS
jgi:hypothetical protein